MNRIRGSITIEASMVLPLFLLTIFSLVYFIKIIYIHEQVQQGITEAAKEMAIGSYIFEYAGLIDVGQELYEGIGIDGLERASGALWEKVTAKLVNQHISQDQYKKWGIVNGAKGMDYRNSHFFLKEDDLMIAVSYQIELPFFNRLFHPIEMVQAVKMRGATGNGNFIGRHKVGGKGSDENGDLVYVTTHGKRYHSDRSCRYIDVKIKSKTYQELKGLEVICEVCKKKGEPLHDLSCVYSTDKSSIFHTSTSCWTIKREVRGIKEEEAISSGLSHCSKCKVERGE